MAEILEQIKNGYVLTYIALILVTQVVYVMYRTYRSENIIRQRRKAGLPPNILINQSKKLTELKKESTLQAMVLILPVVTLPFILTGISVISNTKNNPTSGLFYTFLIFLAWIAFSATDLAKAAIGGIAFRTVMIYSDTVQVGDRVTISGYSGKLLNVGIFYIILETADDDKICLPINSLWGAPLVSANAGDRSSLCVIPFYLAPSVSSSQLQAAEDAIWDAIQTSIYFEPAKPKQIFYQQHPQFIELTAKSYVASTYNEPLFRSEVSNTFLRYALKNNIPLANKVTLVNFQKKEMEQLTD